MTKELKSLNFGPLTLGLFPLPIRNRQEISAELLLRIKAEIKAEIRAEIVSEIKEEIIKNIAKEIFLLQQKASVENSLATLSATSSPHFQRGDEWEKLSVRSLSMRDE